ERPARRSAVSEDDRSTVVSVRQLPQAQLTVDPAGEGVTPVPGEGHTLRGAAVTPESPDLLTRRQVPQPDRAVAAGGQESPPVARAGKAEDAPTDSQHLGGFLFEVPDLHLVPPRGEDSLAVGHEGDAAYGLRVPFQP